MNTTYTKFLDLLIPKALEEPLAKLQTELDDSSFAQVLNQLQGLSKQLETVVQERQQLNIHIDNLVIDNRKYIQRSERKQEEASDRAEELESLDNYFEAA